MQFDHGRSIDGWNKVDRIPYPIQRVTISHHQSKTGCHDSLRVAFVEDHRVTVLVLDLATAVASAAAATAVVMVDGCLMDPSLS